jgi:hypothetical protein
MKQFMKRLKNLQLLTSLVNWCNNPLSLWMKHPFAKLVIEGIMVNKHFGVFNMPNYKRTKSLGFCIIEPPPLGHSSCSMIHMQ